MGQLDDVQLLHQRLRKAAKDEATPSAALLDLLHELAKTPMTLPMLKETRLGLTVGKLRKHPNADVAHAARKLVKEWKSVALSPRENHSNASNSAPKIERKASTTSSSSSTSSSTTASNGLRKAPRKPVAASSGPLVPPGFDKMRGTVRTKLKDTLELSQQDGKAADVALAIEITMAQHFHMGEPNENKKEYLAKFRQLSFNLKKNAPLRDDVVQDMVSAEQLIKMTPEQLATEERQHEIQKLRDDAFQAARLDWEDANEDKINKQCGIKHPEGLFTCGRCKSTKTTNTQKQTRSADEPMTVFVHCHNCGNRWKC